ncbi:hypothetical protein RRG08_020099 [Elysia crispata]|uniref:Uncharacterized protein n=1 Tax=Elysia crispata TaxID=231223 RepID=A0AAE1A576_9GAST|nr:hypothetical protein RRG08_020099 [Elysia crispata]
MASWASRVSLRTRTWCDVFLGWLWRLLAMFVESTFDSEANQRALGTLLKFLVTVTEIEPTMFDNIEQ